jgi:hypothetical protein
VIEAGNAEEEALAIAVALREAVHEQKTAALVTADRALARRVGAALGRWNIVANDSGGDALPDTEAGVFARLAAAVALEELPPVKLLALTKHAHFRLGTAAGAHARAVAALELAILRGPRPRPGVKGLLDALATFRAEKLHPSDPRRAVKPIDLEAAHALVVALGAALAPLCDLRPPSFGAIAARHAQALQALSRDDAGNEMAFAGIDGAELARAFEDILEQPDDFPVSPANYADLFETAIADRVCRRAETPGAHVRILGPLEARLLNVDRVVLGALVDGVWPPETRSDPWLSRPMRLALGLDLPERRVGLSAHDFAQLLGTREVILSRAAKLGGAPTVASRFTQRLAAVSRRGALEGRARARRKISRLGARSRPQRSHYAGEALRVRCRRSTRARMALASRRSRTCCAIPYTIYARHVLELRPLDAVDTPPGARDRGTVIHGAIGDFTEKYAKALPTEPLDALLRLGEARFAVLQDFPEARAFWWPRFLRIARWFIAWEAGRRAEATALHAEVSATLPIAIGTRNFALRTRADRIEQRRDGSYAILDYKTGSTPTERQVRTWPLAAAHAGRRDPAPGWLPGYRRRIDQRGRLCGTARRRAGGRTSADRVQGGDARRACRPGARHAAQHPDAFRRSRNAVSLAGQPDVEGALWRLRPSGAHQGMVGRRRGRGNGMMFPYGRWAASGGEDAITPPLGRWVPPPLRGRGSCGDVTAVPTLATPTPSPSPRKGRSRPSSTGYGGGELHRPRGATCPGLPHGPRASRNDRRPNPARNPRRAARRLGSVAVGLGRGQRRLGQDACAGAARDPPAAARHAAGKDPLPHLHQGRRRQHGEPRVRHARRVDRDGRCGARSRDREDRGRRPSPRGACMRGGCSRRRSTRRAA